jgi:alkylhydroperoxidase/carboxymuconolactone decarboxylase family protein YurZ
VDLVTSFLNHGQVSEPAASKVRALAGLAALMALKSPAEELAMHVNSALNAGASREEILAAIVEASLYSGFDAAHAGLEAALAVLDDAPHAYARAT